MLLSSWGSSCPSIHSDSKRQFQVSVTVDCKLSKSLALLRLGSPRRSIPPAGRVAPINEPTSRLRVTPRAPASGLAWSTAMVQAAKG